MQKSGLDVTRDSVITEIKKDEFKDLEKTVNKETQFLEGKMKRLTIDIPGNLHKAFKKAAIVNDTTMVDVVRGWIESYARENN